MSGGRRSWLIKILIALFALNVVSLYLYFISHPIHTLHFRRAASAKNYPPPLEKYDPLTENRRNRLASPQPKPWPILPSYLPWLQNPNVPFRSCEAYFGNGFNRRADLLPQSSGGWFRCFYSETLRSSVCEGSRIQMDPEKIRMSRGGEELEEVIGRREEEELPEFEFGAFNVENVEGRMRGKRLALEEDLDEYLPAGSIMRHTMRDLVRSIRMAGRGEVECDQWVEEATLLVTRFEYANLFHTVTDWYSAYVASRVTGLPYRPHVVFVDGHCQAPLEETWRALFSSVRYAKNFTRPVCFRHIILSPLGYETALFKGLTEDVGCRGASASDLWRNPDDRTTARLSEFGEMIRAAFEFSVDRHNFRRPFSGHNVLFIRREDYLAHPRHSGRPQVRLSNEMEVFDSVKKWLSNYTACRVDLVNGVFAHMAMKEQVRAIQDAPVIIGAHGAGLTHIVSAKPKTVVLEIISSQYRRPHFELISRWRGLEYHAINLSGSYADPAVVVDLLSSILRSLEC